MYVNHCTEEDIILLQAFDVNITGKIFLARYGGLIPAYRKVGYTSVLIMGYILLKLWLHNCTYHGLQFVERFITQLYLSWVTFCWKIGYTIVLIIGYILFGRLVAQFCTYLGDILDTVTRY